MQDVASVEQGPARKHPLPKKEQHCSSCGEKELEAINCDTCLEWFCFGCACVTLDSLREGRHALISEGSSEVGCGEAGESSENGSSSGRRATPAAGSDPEDAPDLARKDGPGGNEQAHGGGGPRPGAQGAGGTARARAAAGWWCPLCVGIEFYDRALLETVQAERARLRAWERAWARRDAAGRRAQQGKGAFALAARRRDRLAQLLFDLLGTCAWEAWGAAIDDVTRVTVRRPTLFLLRAPLPCQSARDAPRADARKASLRQGAASPSPILPHPTSQALPVT